MTLVEFLRARLDEDEVTAREAAEHGEGVYHSPLQARFWSPRVLAEVEAKRQIIALYRVSRDRDQWMQNAIGDAPLKAATAAYLEVLKRLALPYDDHPSYQQDWRP